MLAAVDFPTGKVMTRVMLACRVGEDDYLFWAVEPGHGDALYADTRGRD